MLVRLPRTVKPSHRGTPHHPLVEVPILTGNRTFYTARMTP